jgi:CheY-like chemotaxis protein/HPt (histidine-containing phosphotransfer) domain-containing protein
MGGKLQLASEPGVGSTFSFEIAFAQCGGQALRQHGAAELRGLRVLVVDDNATNREIIEHQLGGWSVACVSVANGAQALGSLHSAHRRGSRFDAVLLDLHMPEMSGIELARAIRGDPDLAATPLVMLSSGIAGLSIDGEVTGLIDCQLAKPARQADLFDALATVTADRIPAASRPAPPPVSPAQPVERRTFVGRVLLVEDHPVNQELAMAMLANLGVDPTLAPDGRQALDLLSEKSFDLVLMDCQMPEMDGFEATAAIRAAEHCAGAKRRMPVVALTANAIEGDRERCLAAGMDDYLSKPFSRAQLEAMLARWLPRMRRDDEVEPVVDVPTATTATPATTAPAGPAQPLVAVNPRALATICSVDPRGGKGLLRKVVTTYITDTAARLGELAAALGEGDVDTIAKVAHALKSASSNVGADVLASLFQELEERAPGRNVEVACTLIDRAISEYVRVAEELRRLVESEGLQ